GLAAAAHSAGDGTAPFETPDSGRYLALAADLVRNGSYTFEGRPELFRPPGYPVLLAVGTWVGHPAGITIGLQALVGVLTVFLCFLAGRLTGDPRLGLAVALIYACEPGQWAWSTLLVTETM